MKKLHIITSLHLIMLLFFQPSPAQDYQPNWELLDARPVPEWFTDAKFGIFIHWGVYSVPSYRPVSERMYETYAEWYEARVMNPGDPGYAFHVENYGADFAYRQFAPMFKAELFEPDLWADLFKRSGARYVVLTSKHHDGYCLWPASSPYSENWNSMDVGPERDLLGELTASVREQGLKMGIYYSLMEWETTTRNHEWSGGFNDYYLPKDIVEKYGIDEKIYVDDHMLPQLKELVNNYQPAVIFADGEWDKTHDYWKSTEFLAWLYNNAPNKEEVVVNDRWGKDTRGAHGGYYTSEYASDQHEMSAAHPWEESRGMGESYGYNRAENIDDYNSSEELLLELIKIVSNGGNLLLNIGPTADGRIPVIMQQRLIDIGEWLDINGDAIYGTQAWDAPADPGSNNELFFTRKGNDLYAISAGFTANEMIIHGITLKKDSQVILLGCPDCKIKAKNKNGNLTIGNSAELKCKAPHQYAHVLKITGVL